MYLKKKPNGTSKAEEYTVWKENLTRSAKCRSRLCLKKTNSINLKWWQLEIDKTLAQREQTE